MIHLSIQDIALLANLAGCCNSADEFVEYAVRSFGTNSALLSGQNEPAEFAVSYESIKDINLAPTQRQMFNAYNTIKALQDTPESISYKFDLVSSISNIKNVVGSKELADLATTVYGGIYRLKHAPTTYKAYVYITIGLNFIKCPVPVNYQTIKSLITPQPGGGAYGDTDYIAYTYNTFDEFRMPQTNLPQVYVTIDSIQHPRGETLFNIISPKVLFHQRGNLSDLRVDNPVIYESPKVLYHHRWNLSDMPVDGPILYNSPKLIEHVRWDRSDMPVDIPVSYVGPNLIEHVRWDRSDMPVDGPVIYNSPKLIEHVRWDRSDMPVDIPVSYIGPNLIEHVRWDRSDMPVDGAILYNSPTLIEHNRWDRSDQPVDHPVSYSSPALIEHVRWDRSDQPIDGQLSYASPTLIDHNRFGDHSVSYGSPALIEQTRLPIDEALSYSSVYKVRFSDGEEVSRFDLGANYPTLIYFTNLDPGNVHQAYSINSTARVNYLPDRSDHLANTLQNLHNIQYWNLDDYLSTSVQTLHDIKGFIVGDYIVETIQSLDKVIYYHPDDFLVYVTQSMYTINNMNLGDHLVNSLIGMFGLKYGLLGDYLVTHTQDLISTSLRDIPGDSRTASVTEIKNLKRESEPLRGSQLQTIHAAYLNIIDDYRAASNTTVNRITRLSNRGDEVESASTVSKLETPSITRVVNAHTPSLHEHTDCHYLYCDNEDYTWNDYCVNTRIDNYHMPVNIYGVSKIRITLHQHIKFDSKMYTRDDGMVFDSKTGLSLPPWPLSGPANLGGTLLAGEAQGLGIADPSTGLQIDNYPLGPGNVAISEIRAIRNNETIYPLSADDVIIETCNCPIDITRSERGIVGSFALSSIVNGNLLTTYEQASANQDAFMVHNEPMCITFHLPDTIDIRYIDIAPICIEDPDTPGFPLSAASHVFHAPGWVVIEGYYPGCREWFVMSYEHTPNRYLDNLNSGNTTYDFGEWNQLSRTWAPGKFTRFPIVNGIRRYKPREMYSKLEGRSYRVHGQAHRFVSCCDSGVTMLGVSGMPIEDTYHERCGNGLYATVR